MESLVKIDDFFDQLVRSLRNRRAKRVQLHLWELDNTFITLRARDQLK